MHSPSKLQMSKLKNCSPNIEASLSTRWHASASCRGTVAQSNCKATRTWKGCKSSRLYRQSLIQTQFPIASKSSSKEKFWFKCALSRQSRIRQSFASMWIRSKGASRRNWARACWLLSSQTKRATIRHRRIPDQTLRPLRWALKRLMCCSVEQTSNKPKLSFKSCKTRLCLKRHNHSRWRF